MAEKLFWGDAGTIGTANANPTYVQADSEASLYDGFITKIRIYSINGGSLKTSVYNTSSSVPGSLIYADNVGQSVSVGWNDIDIYSPIQVLNSVVYSIGVIGSQSGAASVKSAGGLTRYYKGGQVYSSFSASDPFAHTGTDTIYRTALAVYGWEPPNITGIDDSTIIDGQSGLVLSGTDFMDSGSTLELCNNSVYASATQKISQTVTSHDDTSMTFTSSNGGTVFGNSWLFITTTLGQVSNGLQVNMGRSVYVFVTNNDGQRNPVGFPITMFE